MLVFKSQIHFLFYMYICISACFFFIPHALWCHYCIARTQSTERCVLVRMTSMSMDIMSVFDEADKSCWFNNKGR